MSIKTIVTVVSTVRVNSKLRTKPDLIGPNWENISYNPNPSYSSVGGT